MNTTARLVLAALIATAITVLSGCANHPELRPYTAEETRQLQLEALARQGLTHEEYERQRVAILRADTAEVVADSVQARAPFSG
ncbi:hypothetical protein CCOS865_04007 [Pseudomonas reidholzensis]|uniref:Lipoprotein n=1 Tax=Pseudomonas reidholzensis TaxID=1785162 RepID=A0A383RXB5_9PSED|nr:hypothetical protein [Pseudomonas reidholzensis]SYX91727.1 hypothetical protein CCOS865_04007 [Pseudomonas reidholzensis]